MAEQFKMPVVEIGETVLWWIDNHKTGQGVPALVMTVGDRTINVMVFQENHAVGIHRDGVRHFADPVQPEDQMGELGCWDHMPITIRQRKMLDAFESKQNEVKQAKV